MLELKNIYGGYQKIKVLFDVNLKVKKGEFVALVGPNGVGKTTCLRTMAGILKPTKGEVFFKGNRIDGLPPHKINRMGISFITATGDLFNGMTVKENLDMGAFIIDDKHRVSQLRDKIFELFPRLEQRKKQLAGTLSGGEQKMLSLARGLMGDPTILLVDEPSLGLAPNLVLSVFEALIKLKKTGVTILLVEQNVNTTLKITDRAYVLEQGQIVLEGKSQELMKNDHVKNSYLGLA